MNEWESLSEQERDFINYLRTARGPCPDDETWLAFQQGTLPPDQAEEVQAHVHLCGTCQADLQVLKRFAQCEAGELPEPPDWPEVQKRGRERFYAFLEQQKPVASGDAPSWWLKLKGVFLHPAFAYLLLAALVYPAYRGLVGQPEVVTKVVPEKQIVEVEKPGLEIASLRTFELRSSERAVRSRPQVVRVDPDEPYFALSFLVPISERPEFIYEVEIRDSQGRVVAVEKSARPQDELGNFFLVCRRDLFSPGRYELQVKEVNKTTHAVRQEFNFSFTVSERR
jgi:hypothetical protein